MEFESILLVCHLISKKHFCLFVCNALQSWRRWSKSWRMKWQPWRRKRAPLKTPFELNNNNLDELRRETCFSPKFILTITPLHNQHYVQNMYISTNPDNPSTLWMNERRMMNDIEQKTNIFRYKNQENKFYVSTDVVALFSTVLCVLWDDWGIMFIYRYLVQEYTFV